MQLALARKLVKSGKEHLAEKRPAQAQAALEKSRELFGRLRAAFSNLHWTVLTPAEMKTKTGAKMELQNDGSVFVRSMEPAKEDSYTLVFPSELRGITGLRLEALADRRLPGGGPGWNPDGNFVLNELTLQAAPTDSPDKTRAIALRYASADFSQGGREVKGAADGEAWTGWSVLGELNRDHTAVFETLENTGDGQASRLTVQLSHLFETSRGQSDGNLGRFRLSFTNDAATLEATRIRLDLKDSELVDLYTALAKARAQQGHINEAVAVFSEALPRVADRAESAKIIAEAAPFEGTLEKLAERAGDDALFQAELARHYAERGDTSLADAARTRARTLFEDKLAKAPENPASAGDLADVLLPPIEAKTMIVPTSEVEAVSWRFTTKQPPVNWMNEAFDDSTWTTGPGAFGSNGSAPGLVLRTEWTTTDIWLRRRFEWRPDASFKSLLARVIHDDGFELFLNGERILEKQDYKITYDFYPAADRAHALLKSGMNTMAVHCSSTSGLQYIDVGLLGLSTDPGVTGQRVVAMKIADPRARLAAAYSMTSDQPALDRLLKRYPKAASGIGDVYAAREDWKRALAEYDKAITPECSDANLFAARAGAHEKLEHWELAAADWGDVDLHAVDKRARYGLPSFVALEHRAQIHERLQQFEKMVLDCSELLKPERLGDNPWIYRLRAEAYDHLRQWQKARADHDQAIKVSSPAERWTFQCLRTATSPRKASGSKRSKICIKPIKTRPLSARGPFLAAIGGSFAMRR